MLDSNFCWSDTPRSEGLDVQLARKTSTVRIISEANPRSLKHGMSEVSPF